MTLYYLANAQIQKLVQLFAATNHKEKYKLVYLKNLKLFFQRVSITLRFTSDSMGMQEWSASGN